MFYKQVQVPLWRIFTSETVTTETRAGWEPPSLTHSTRSILYRVTEPGFRQPGDPLLSDTGVISVEAMLVPVSFLQLQCCDWSLRQDRDELCLIHFHDYTS